MDECKPLASGDYGRLSELLGSLDLLEIMDQSARPYTLSPKP